MFFGGRAGNPTSDVVTSRPRVSRNERSSPNSMVSPPSAFMCSKISSTSSVPKMRTVSSRENEPSVSVARSSAREMRPSASASCSSSLFSSRWIGFCMSLWRWRTFSFSAYSRAASVSGRGGGSAPGSSQLRVMSVSSPANSVKPSVRGFAGLKRADRGYCDAAWSSGWSRRRKESRGSMESHHPSNTWVGLLQRRPPST